MNDKPEGSENPLLMEHDADGIKELDNLLPRWWVWLFYLTTFYGIGYVGYYHVFKLGDLQLAAYRKEAQAGEKIKSAAMAKFESALGAVEPSKDPQTIANGRNTFMTYCAPCHRADGGGLVGPNLCDDYWIHGPKFEDNVKTIWNGIPEKGMVTWKGVLKPSEILDVASFIYTLRGTKPPNPKPPENQQSKEPEKPSNFE